MRLGHCSAYSCWETGTAWHSEGGRSASKQVIAWLGTRGRGEKLLLTGGKNMPPAAARLEAVGLLRGSLRPAALNPVASVSPTEPARPMGWGRVRA